MMPRLFRWLDAAGKGKGLPTAEPPAARDGSDDAMPAFEQGLAHYREGNLEPAEIAFRSALELKHDLAEAHFFLGLIHRKRGELEEAADQMLMATAFKADFADAWFQLGAIDLARRNFADAHRSLDTALRLNPRHVEAHSTYAGVREQQKRFAAAIAHWKVVVEADPGNAYAYCKLCRLTLRESQDDEAAMNYARRALELQPGLAEAHSCLAQILQFQGRCQDAIEACNIALQLEPGAYHTRMIRALALLSIGQFEAGWQDYEMRKRVYPLFAVRKHPYPEWDGSSLAGARLLIYCEQGIGDEIMFASCVPDVLRAGADCILECSRRLEPIFSRSFPAATVVVADQTSPDLSYLQALPKCDFQVAAGSLPRFFRRGLNDFPVRSGYLSADPDARARWRARLRSLGDGLKIGLSWRGGVRQTDQAGRSIALETLLPLLRIAGCHFVSLQYGEQEKEVAHMRSSHGVTLASWPDALLSYDDTAALTSAMDLVLSVATSIVHLAGAMGVPTWTLLPANAEWRYRISGASMPWYPGMRIFRRPHGLDWVPAIEEVARELRALLRAKGLSS